MQRTLNTHDTPPRWVVVATAVSLAAVVIGGAWFYVQQEATIRTSVEHDLAAISSLKVDQISRWRDDRLADGQRVTSSPGIPLVFQDWLDTATPESAASLKSTLESLRYGDRYAETLFVSPEGVVLASTEDTDGTAAEIDRQALDEAFATRRPVLTDLYRPPGIESVCIDVIAPVFTSQSDGAPPLGAILLHAHANDFLFPLVQSWPMPSETAETLLVMRDGDDALFLNDLLHTSDAPLTLRIPLTDTEVPAVMAIHGQTGVTDGIDYRGENVLSYMSPIPDSPWYMIAKIDNAEAFGSWRSRALTITAMTLLLAGAVVGVMAVLWMRARNAGLSEALASRQAYEDLFANMLDGFAVHQIILDDEGRPVDYRFLAVNPAFEQLTGLSADDVIGRTVLEVLPGTEPEWIERFGGVALTGEPVRFQGHSQELDKHFDVNAFRSDEGRFAALFQDVTERVRLTAELETHQQHLEYLVDERTEELQATSEELEASNEELQAMTEELEASNEDLLATAKELSRVNQDLLEANDAKTSFLRSMSHELRTPLNSVIGFSGFMLDGLTGAVNDEQRHQLEMINQSGRHLLALINDILDLSRIEAGKATLELESFGLRQLVDEVMESVALGADERGLELHLLGFSDQEPDIEMHSDCRKIRQILLNLLGNAVKFTQEGSVTLEVARLAPGSVAFRVTDTGPGIPANERIRIFGEFEQGGSRPRTGLEGTGLGLAIARRLAGLLGGAITLESTVGVGSTFTLLLPESVEDDTA